MALFILGIVILLVGFCVGIYFVLRKFDKRPSLGVTCIIAALLLSAVCFVCSCITNIPTGHTGVVTVFGKVEETTLDAGIHFKAPWESVVKMDNRVQKETVELSCFSSDLQEVNVKYTLNYQINKETASEIYKSIGKQYEGIAVTPTIAESVKTVVAKFTAEDLIGDRATLASKIEEELTVSLNNYHIDLVSTAIEDMDFTDAFTNAVEAKQVAAQNKLQAEIEQAQKTMEAEQAAERTKIEANAAAEVAKIQAQADMEVAQIGADSAEYQGRKEASIKMQALASINGWTVQTDDNGVNILIKADGTSVTAEELAVGTERLIEYYYTQTWNGVLPDTYVGDDSVSSIILGD